MLKENISPKAWATHLHFSKPQACCSNVWLCRPLAGICASRRAKSRCLQEKMVDWAEIRSRHSYRTPSLAQVKFMVKPDSSFNNHKTQWSNCPPVPWHKCSRPSSVHTHKSHTSSQIYTGSQNSWPGFFRVGSKRQEQPYLASAV